MAGDTPDTVDTADTVDCDRCGRTIPVTKIWTDSAGNTVCGVCAQEPIAEVLP